MIEEGVKKDIDMSLIDFHPDNEEIFGHDDIEYLAEEMNEEGFSGVIELYEKDNGRYEISSGHRRYLAAQRNKMSHIPSIVYQDTDDVTKAKRVIMKNIHNRRMTPLKWAKSLDYYDKKVLSVEKDENGKKKYEGRKRDVLAKKFNLSPATVHRYMSLLKLIPEFQKYVDQQNFPYYNFYAITQLDEETQRELYVRLMDMSSDGDFAALSRVFIEQTINQMLKQKEQKKLQELIKQEENTQRVEPQVIKQPDDRISVDERQPQAYEELKPMEEFLQESNDGFIQTDFDNYVSDDFAVPSPQYSSESTQVSIKKEQLLYYISQIEECADHISILISDNQNLNENVIDVCVKRLESIINKINK